MTPDRTICELLDLLEAGPPVPASPRRRRADAAVDAAYEAWRSNRNASAYRRYLDAEARAERLAPVEPQTAPLLVHDESLHDNRLVGARA